MQQFPDYKNKRVVVSGCFSGIGHATARALIGLGAEVHGVDVKQSDLELHSFARVDLREPASIDAAVARIGGTVHGLFNCAGLPPGPPPLDVMKVNYIGTRHLTDQVLTLMRPGGAIVNVSSNGGAAWNSRLSELRELVAAGSFDAAADWYDMKAASLPAAYSFSKEAIIVWTMTIAATLIRQGIRVNCTTPGAVQTPMLEEIEKTTPSALIDIVAQPIGRRSQPDEQAWPLVFLNSDAASYVNGAILPVDGGFLSTRSLG